MLLKLGGNATIDELAVTNGEETPGLCRVQSKPYFISHAGDTHKIDGIKAFLVANTQDKSPLKIHWHYLVRRALSFVLFFPFLTALIRRRGQ